MSRVGVRRQVIPLLAALQLMGLPLAAQSPGLDSIIPARPTDYVSDFANVVSPEIEAELNSLLARLRAAAGVEIAAVTLPTIGRYEPEQVGLEIGRRWGVGAAAEIGDATRNAGLVILLAPRQDGRPGTGAIRIETGFGMEGVITDAEAGRIRDMMIPEASREEYGPALRTGVRAVVARTAEAFDVSDSTLRAVRVPQPGGGGGGGSPWLPIIFMLVFFVILPSLGGRGRRRRRRGVYWGPGPWIGGGGGWGGGGGGFGGGFGGFGGGGGFSGGGAGGRF